LLGEGYTKTFAELMDTTDWDSYGVGKYEKCADCMVHCGFEATAVTESFARPWQVLAVAIRGIGTDGPISPDIALDRQRPAEYVFARHVEHKLGEIKETEAARNHLSAAE
jgi:hypothetical protein